ncbi:MAG: CHAT domain-containing protein, partial [Lapillicoccus sp.]
SRCTALMAGSPTDPVAIKATHNLGFLDYVAGDIPAALRRYAEVEARYAIALPGVLPMLRLDRARALLAVGLFTEADDELARAADQLGEQGSYQDQAEARLARADAALLAGRPDSARRLARKSLTVFARRDNPRWAARARLLLARAQLASGGREASEAGRTAPELAATMRGLGLLEDAEVAALVGVLSHVRGGSTQVARQAMTAVVTTRGARLESRLLHRLAEAELAVGEGRDDVAYRELRRGLETLRVARAQLATLDLQTGAAVLGRDLAQLGLRTALASGSVARAFRWSELARAQALLLPPARPTDDGDRSDGTHDSARAEREEMRALGIELAGVAPDETRGRVLRARRKRLQRIVREHDWGAKGPGTSERPASLRSVHDQLEDRAMVVYVRDAGRLGALVVSGSRARTVPLGGVAPVEESVRRLRADLDALAGRSLSEPMEQAILGARSHDAAAVRAMLLDPLLHLIGDRELVVVPTGFLVTVPWAAVVPCRPVTVSPSATTWVMAYARMTARSSLPDRALLVAGPGNPLGTPEVDAIAALRTVTGGARPVVLNGAGATASATLAHLPETDIVHLAAHGHHETDNALFSGLELVGGPLMGYDLYRLHRAPRMVILSACDLGLHDVRPGDESLGMGSALLSAGSSTVLASVSRVGDQAAMTLMVEVHRRLLGGASPATALASATSEDLVTGFVCFGAG